MRRQIEQAKVDAQTQVKAIQGQVDAAKAETEQLVKAMRGELAAPPARRPARKTGKQPPS